MRIVRTEYLIRGGAYDQQDTWRRAIHEIEVAVSRIVWPPNNPSGKFVINPQSGKKRGEGNGVKPIKKAFLEALSDNSWSTDDRHNPERFDAVKRISDSSYIAVEWETGNISSSHRAINRFLLAQLQGGCRGGLLVLPTRKLYRYLTDRVGNYEELERFFPVWRAVQWKEGALAVMAIEHDGEDIQSPRIEKGTDGRALL